MDGWRGARRCAAALLAGALLCLLGAAAAADPAASDWFETDQGKVRLVAAETATGIDKTLQLGLEFRLAPGWKVYWRAPGDAGLPPEIDWSGSRNLAAAEISWPAPRRFTAFNLETIGYEDEVVLPIAARVAQPGEPLALNAALRYLTCKEICIPYETAMQLTLPAGTPAPSDHAELIAHYAAQVPSAATAQGLQLSSTRIVAGAVPTLTFSVRAATPFASPDIFLEGPAGLSFGAPAVTLARDRLSAVLTVPVGGGKDAAQTLVAAPLRATLVDGARALDTETTPVPGAPPAAPLRLAAVLGFALLGGFILNFMPCVLPVLSIKLLSVMAHAGASRCTVRRGFLASAAGILTAMLALAAAMIALRGSGLAIGWGMQFQQPLFLVLMIALVGLFAANLAGLYEIPLPAWLGGLAVRERDGGAPLGDFGAGIFATLLATPCSAPYLGTAIGFALAGSAVEILAVFLALGVGLALPYLAVAAFPRLATLLPRPGRWMLVLRRILALLLAATALWLLFILAAQTSMAAASAVAVALLVAVVLLALVRTPFWRRAGATLALLAAFLLPLAVPAPTARSSVDGIWHPFDDAAIPRLVGEGKIVFVDVTADWCVNCKVNERLVLAADAVAGRLAERGIVAMRADWTRPDDAIAAFLRGFGRSGIPFYAVYGPAAPEGLALPELLSSGTVLEALDRVAPPPGAAGAPEAKTLSPRG